MNKGHGSQFRYCNIAKGLTLAMAVASLHPHDAAWAMAWAAADAEALPPLTD